MTDQTESDGLDHTRDGVPEGRLLHASPVLPAEGESECAGLLSIHDRVGKWGAAFDSEPMQTAAATAFAIRALEAKVAGFRVGSEAMARAGAKLRADRDRLAGEGERLTTHVSRLEHANDTAFAEVARLTSELAAARENEARYLHIKSVCEARVMERAIPGRREWAYYLWTIVPNCSFDAAIDAARSAGGEG